MRISCPCNSSFSFTGSDTIYCPGCSKYQHIDCISPCHKMSTYLCPSCQLKKSNLFIKPLRNILPPSLLIFNEVKSYTFTPFLFNYLVDSKKQRYVIITCLKLSEEGFTIEWPENCDLKLNDVVVFSFGKILTVDMKKRQKQPIYFSFYKPLKNDIFIPKVLNIKEYFKNNISNTLVFNMLENHNKYVISIDYIEIISDLNEIIRKVPVVSNNEDIRDIIYKGESVPIKTKVSLIDVYSGVNKVSIPSRGVYCSHPEAFDLVQYLRLQKKVLNFKCPHCKKKVCLLYIDNTMKEIIRKSNQMGVKYIYMNENMEMIEDESYKEMHSESDTEMKDIESDIENESIEEEGEIKEISTNSSTTSEKQRYPFDISYKELIDKNHFEFYKEIVNILKN